MVPARPLRAALAALVLGGALSSARAATEPRALVLFNRPVADLRATLGGLGPAERVARAQRRFDALGDAALTLPVSTRPLQTEDGTGLTLEVDGRPVFSLLPADLDPEDHQSLEQAVAQARLRLADALHARHAQSDPGTLGRGLATVLAVLLAWGAGGWGVLRLHGWLDARADAAGEDSHHAGWRTYARLAGWRLLTVLAWLLAAGLLYGGVLAALAAFPWSLPWSEHLAGFVHRLGGWLLTGLMAAVPGLLTVALVLAVARIAQEVLDLLFGQVQAGRLRLPFVHLETAGATRRLLVGLLWGLALAAAYPYLPGAGTDAFKGLSVLFGIMITLGSSGVMTQLMSGLVVVYSRSLKRGDFVSVDGVEGVVREVGALAVKVVTMRNEEVTLPHSVITASPIRNYSKLSGSQGTLVSTQVTIGYDTPWRQVHALLVNAALATPGLRAHPQPFVYQRALGDFFVVYELFAHIDQPLDRVPILSALHAAVQDEFNRHGVQIMSPHFYEQPGQALVVPESRWWTPPARRPD